MQNGKSIRLTPTDMQAIDAAIDYIRREYRSRISADQLSIEVSLPIEKLQAGIQKKTNLSLHRYLLTVRIEQAKELLASTNAPVKSIAFKTGFRDESYFCKVFKRLAEITPIAFRLKQVG